MPKNVKEAVAKIAHVKDVTQIPRLAVKEKMANNVLKKQCAVTAEF